MPSPISRTADDVRDDVEDCLSVHRRLFVRVVEGAHPAGNIPADHAHPTCAVRGLFIDPQRRDRRRSGVRSAELCGRRWAERQGLGRRPSGARARRPHAPGHLLHLAHGDVPHHARGNEGPHVHKARIGHHRRRSIGARGDAPAPAHGLEVAARVGPADGACRAIEIAAQRVAHGREHRIDSEAGLDLVPGAADHLELVDVREDGAEAMHIPQCLQHHVGRGVHGEGGAQPLHAVGGLEGLDGRIGAAGSPGGEDAREGEGEHPCSLACGVGGVCRDVEAPMAHERPRCAFRPRQEVEPMLPEALRHAHPARPRDHIEDLEVAELHVDGGVGDEASAGIGREQPGEGLLLVEVHGGPAAARRAVAARGPAAAA